MMNSNIKIHSRIERVDLMTTMKGNGKANESAKQMGSLLDSQPWISAFKTMCIMDQFSASSLNNLMAYFIRNVRPNVNECKTKPLRADKLRGFISENLLLFLYYCRAQEEKCDDAAYMTLMSDLLAIYIDTELKASKRSNECHEIISGRIASCLHVYLGNSAEYLLDTLFKVRFMSSNYHQILHPIISKIFELIPKHPNSNLMYVRYFLVYRLWKRITKDQNAKNEINSKAMSSLCSTPTSFPQHIMDYVLPKVPNTSKITTRYLLQQPIELAQSCESFVQFCRKSKGLRDAVEMEQNGSNVVAESFELEDELPCKLRLSINENSTTNNPLSIVDSSKQLNVKSNSEINSRSKLSCKSLTKRETSSSSNFMLIDLTSDDSPDRIIKHKVKTNQKRLSWTQSLLKKKSIVAVTAENKNQDYKIFTEDLQLLEDTIKIRSLNITSNDSDWIIGLELTASEMAELNSPIADESTMKIDEFMTSNHLCNDLIEDPTTSHVIETNEFTPSCIIDDVNSKTGMKEILFNNTQSESVVQTPHEFMEVVEEAEVEVTTTDSNIADAPSEYIHSNANTSNNEYLVEVTLSSSDSDVKNDTKLNTSTVKTNTLPDLTGPTSDTALNLNECLPSTDIKLDEIEASKIQDTELHEHIDGLSLLASVSQRVSHLSTTSDEINTTREVIKVKDYHSLIDFENQTGNNEQELLICGNVPVDNSNNITIFPDDDMDRVALHVEVTSSEDTFDQSYMGTMHKQEPMNNYCLSNNEQANEQPITPLQVESSIQSDKEDTNVILNGETIVLLQKSPNSNLYIINKAAVDNREHDNDGNDENNPIENNQTIDKVNDGMYSYEIYDSIYRMGQTASSKPAYELSQNSGDSVRTTSMEAKKMGKNKNNNEVMSPRRRRVKQEFNGCTNSVCQDLVDAHSIHIPSSTSLYHPNYATGDLFISCRPNCNPVACGMSVNHPATPIHSHSKSARCSCLNCAYDIVAHCSQYMLPSGETETTSKIDNGYYIPIQKPSPIQDCSLDKKCNDEKMVDMYDEKLLCKIETVDDEKSTKIYQSEMNSKLPLKKRFKSMLSLNFTETSIKREKVAGNYPSTPMISIAALEPRECTDSSSKLISHQVNSKERIHNGYSNETLNGYHNYQNGDSVSGKRKLTEVVKFPLDNINVDLKRSNGQLARPSKKVKEQKSPKKKATRRTRSSQRQVPRINYSYMDVDCEWNPSGETKRKRKKTNR